MKITVAIAGVDGETNVYMECVDAQSAIGFLSKYDHEGSSVDITIDGVEYGPEDGYAKLLEIASKTKEK